MSNPGLICAQNERNVVRDRHGSVLSRGLVLKVDQRQHPSQQEHLAGMLNLQGAPCFRAAEGGLGVYGLAQPTIFGIKTLLSLLHCRPNAGDAGKELMHCVWVCTREEPVIYVGDRPFVLREAHKPIESLNLSDRAENLESIEKRLKIDILAEAERWGGLLLVHEEHASTGELMPTWVAVQDQDVRTMREVWKSIQDNGWRVQYKRLPIARDQPLEHNYLDAYTQVIKGVDPRNTCFVTNCGAGVWRTTFAMIAAVIVRRRQLMLRTHHDPFDEEPDKSQESVQNERSILLRAPNSGLAHSMRQMQDSMAQNQSLLRLVNVLTESLSMRDTRAAIAELVAQPKLLESLRQANSGGYNIILQLCGLLDEGRECKSIVDMAIDSCQDMINIRESILENRLCYSTAAMDEEQAQSHLARAGKSLEVYYFLIAFASYVQQSRTAAFEHRFVDWLKHRVEIWRGIQRIRTLHQHLSLFDPVADLSDISKNDAGNLAARTAAISKRFGEVAGQGAQITGDEFSHFVVYNRSGTVLHSGLLLKRDVWREFFEIGPQTAVSGVVNFRRVPETNVFGTGQPSVDGIHNLLDSVLRQMAPSPDSLQVVTWINLREEPLVYVRGKPYCLRRRELSLRNMKNYSGITPERLLLLENRLRQDVIAELKNSDGKLLLHTETEDGTVVPLWEDASPDDIATVQQVMDTISNSLPGDVQLVFRRIPITAEKTLELPDVMDLLSTILDAYQETSPIIVNCQLGRGRTTLVSVYILLIERWIQCVRPGSDRCLLLPLPGSAPNGEDRSQRQSYHVTNSLLRVIPHGQEVKRVVDDCIDQCSTILNLRRTIEDARLAALDAQSDAERNRHINSGIRSLQRYAHLLLFQAYLQTIKPETMLSNTFERFVKRQPVLATISKDLDKMDIATITPLRKMDPGDGMALRDEVDEVVQNRSGDILGAQTILKSDFFSGILKAGLPLHVEGMPNLRGVSPLVELGAMTEPPSRNDLPTAHETWGCGMPTVEGLRRGLARMGAGPNGHERTVWTNLREEPVLYVNGRPHVLRLADQPLTNVEATGVTTDVVERIERTLKRDLIKEAHQHGGRVLLHDEVQTEQGDFETIPLWETVKEEHILTPREVYELVQSEGFRVNYARVAITDEQAPVPQVFSQIEDRVQTAIDSKAMTVFNCQMGRGRTTSGMIIAALIVSIDHYGNHMLENQALFQFTKASAHDDEQTVREEDLLMQGEYRCILQLVGVLSNGTLAKALTDRVIDRMKTIQNLRKAILLMKLRADNAEPNSARQKQMRHVYHNYLARYGYLIAFAAYLIDRLQAQQLNERDDDGASSTGAQTPSRQRRSSSVTDHDHPNPMSLSMSMSMSYTPLHDRDYPSFRQWLEKRREIRGVLERAVQE